MKVIRTSWLSVPILVSLASCEPRDVEGRTDSPPAAPPASPAGQHHDQQVDAAPKKTTESASIVQVLAGAEEYSGRRVEITATFNGWSGASGPPPVTRSDWVIVDGKDAIYVTGTLPEGARPPKSGVGKQVVVRGTVRIGKSGRPYISIEED